MFLMLFALCLSTFAQAEKYYCTRNDGGDNPVITADLDSQSAKVWNGDYPTIYELNHVIEGNPRIYVFGQDRGCRVEVRQGQRERLGTASLYCPGDSER